MRYVSKDSSLEELVQATHHVLQGRRYVSPKLADILIEANLAGGSQTLPHERLSDREFQVLCMIVSGKKLTEIAKELGLSVPTISTYRKRLLEKMGMKTNAELTRYAIDYRLLE